MGKRVRDARHGKHPNGLVPLLDLPDDIRRNQSLQTEEMAQVDSQELEDRGIMHELALFTGAFYL